MTDTDTDTHTHTTTLDRIVDGQTAVLLLEDAGETIDQLEVDVGRLPAEGQHEGAVLEVEVVAGEFRDAHYRPDLTASRRDAAQGRLDRLSERLSDRE